MRNLKSTRTPQSTTTSPTSSTRSTATYKTRGNNSYKDLQPTRLIPQRSTEKCPTDQPTTSTSTSQPINPSSIYNYFKEQEPMKNASVPSPTTPEPTSRTKSIVKKFEKMKSIDQADSTIQNSNSVGGNRARPIGCNLRNNSSAGFLCDQKTRENASL